MAGASTKRRGRILYSILLLLFAFGLLPLVGTSWYLVGRLRNELELDTKAIQQAKARALSEQINVYVGSLKAQMDAIARTLELDVPSGRFPERVARIRAEEGLRNYIQGTSPFHSISVADSSGSGTRSGVQLPEPAIERFVEEAFRQGLEGRAWVSHPVFAQSIKEPVVVLSQPVRIKNPKDPERPKVEGALIAVAGLGQLWSMTQQMAQEGRLEVYVVDGRGHLVAHSDPAMLEPAAEDDPGSSLDFSDVEIVKRFLESRGISMTGPFTKTEGGRVRRMLGTYTRVAETGWGVIVQVAEADAYYTAIKMRNLSLGIIALVAVGVVFFGSLFSGQITRPITELARVSRRLAGGDYATRVKASADNEVGILADAFNHMGGEIQKAIEEIRKQAALNKELFMGSIKMLANAIDEKDVYTRGHSERVAYYSMVIARHMGMSPGEVERVYLSGVIHDVGKIGIEDKILRKPSALTDEEYEIMKQHPRKGLHILEAVPPLKRMAGDGLMHHENYDGSGYPEGMRAHDIPFLGRIVSVADAFDAMTTDRPYSKAMTFEAALARLRFLAGKKFDPDCVTGMEKAMAAGDLTAAKIRQAATEVRQTPLPDLS